MQSMHDGGCNDTGCFEIKVRMDIAKLTSFYECEISQIYRKSRDFVTES